MLVCQWRPLGIPAKGPHHRAYLLVPQPPVNDAFALSTTRGGGGRTEVQVKQPREEMQLVFFFALLFAFLSIFVAFFIFVLLCNFNGGE